MKKIIVLILCLVLFVNTNARSKQQSEDYEKVAVEINTFLNEIVLDEEISGSYSFEVLLTANTENRIQVLKVSTHSNSIKRNVKNALNNRPIKPGDLFIGKEYTFIINVKEN